MTFGNWNEETHNNHEQIKRILTAKTIKSDKIIYHEQEKYCEVLGSSGEYYKATLDSCDCMDFRIRNLPCKHIYCTAFSLGYELELTPLNKERAKEFNIDDEINRFYDIYKSGVISAEKFVKIADSISKGK